MLIEGMVIADDWGAIRGISGLGSCRRNRASLRYPISGLHVVDEFAGDLKHKVGASPLQFFPLAETA